MRKYRAFCELMVLESMHLRAGRYTRHNLVLLRRATPPCFTEARAIEEKMIRQWCQEAYDKATL